MRQVVKWESRRRARAVLAAMVAVACVIGLAPTASLAHAAGGFGAGKAPLGAQAVEDGDIMLGVFTGSDEDTTDYVYASYDGETFYGIADAFPDRNPFDRNDNVWCTSTNPWNGQSNDHYSHTCPSIIYHDGYFWMLSNMRWQPGKFWPMVSYSKDLVNWTWSGGMDEGISLDELPMVDGRPLEDFDAIAPEWFVSANGGIYMVFSAGYYGAEHGQLFNDQMQAYIVKITQLSASDGRAHQAQVGSVTTNVLEPVGLTIKADVAKKLTFTKFDRANFIDGALLNDDGTDYLVIKEGGLTNRLLRTANIDDPNAWVPVNDNVSWGYEGASIAKLNDKYHLYSDGVLGTKALGVGAVASSSLTRGDMWKNTYGSDLDHPLFVSTDGNHANRTRHGSVLTLKAGTPEWQVAKSQLDARLDAQSRRVEGVMWRLYNSNSSEHFYTSSGFEAGNLSFWGWNYEGVGWNAPETSSEPVYRLYNPNAGDHHYTTDADERDDLVKLGWQDEGIGWYSADEEGGQPLYRLYNPFATGAGAHHYTTDAGERNDLVNLGWQAEGIGWYGVI